MKKLIENNIDIGLVLAPFYEEYQENVVQPQFDKEVDNQWEINRFNED